MRRREFITILGCAAAWPLAAHAEQSSGTRRIGVLSGAAEGQLYYGAFVKGLAAHGWVEGQNLGLDFRSMTNSGVPIRELAAQMVKASPDVILAITTPALVALRQETGTIPLIFGNIADPVDGGFVKSISHPGGNITGFASFEYSIGGKWLELLKEAAPSMLSVLVLLNQENFTSRGLLRVIEESGRSMQLRTVPASVRNAGEIEAAMDAFGKEPNGGVIVLPDPVTHLGTERIIETAKLRRLPTIHPIRAFAADGGLMSYGTDYLEIYRRAASYADRVLRGENVGDLPVQNPTKFDLVINLNTARSLGLTIPESFLLRANELIE